MGVITVEQEISCSLTPSRLFKSFVLDADKLMPKIMPNFFKSFETVEGDGGVGSIKLVTLTAEVAGSQMKPAKHKIEEVDEVNHVYKYSLIEGGILGEDLESVTYVYKFEAGPTGGCTIKIVKTYHPKGDEHHSIIEEIIEKSKEVTKGFINAIEAHLHANPHEYN
ncbi:hypothetical protein C2S52_014433 [Perilla frutescens var. hirtella]|uniref:Bet v I/Major latex protein domain-containing protein n=1 Tax=Perilla frutescens var. hirtella TaxID=608512 RepID=A0AAD4PA75_PERFH|nr:hypothetical protein C2S52_014433 [Perilla frutescens var. hirtella]KAH6816707.1 hypothetical protein C2S51_021527 [Perilla frutescens var. frutescens]KAH6831971.1 hypothetical protein C2S53_019833 [Perilla frutescens var. hirtella]